jgi:regulator of replication initiation timing
MESTISTQLQDTIKELSVEIRVLHSENNAMRLELSKLQTLIENRCILKPEPYDTTWCSNLIPERLNGSKYTH